MLLPGFTQLISKYPKKTAFCLVGVFVAVFLVCAYFFSVPHVFAQGATGQDVLGVNALDQNLPLAGTDIRIIILRVINIFLSLLGILTVGLILYAGAKILFSNGDEQAVAEGRQIIVNAVIGLAIIMSAWGITRFIISRLGVATGLRGASLVDQNTSGDSFFASGALGRAVREHYPFRNQRDVPRNSRIAVTFREAIYPGSIADDQNGNGIFGDCVVPQGEELNWALHCDHPTTVVQVTASGTAQTIDMAALLTYAADGSVRSVLFRPIELLGSPTEPVTYRVSLGEGIQVANRSASIFAGERGRRYDWTFETNTLLDVTPPTVLSVYPNHNARVARNTIAQVQFSEAMDPTTVQGGTGSFSHIIFGATTPGAVMPSGEWRVTNAYQTAEFVPSDVCGQNSCGDQMYCLPSVCADETNPACVNNLTVLVRTAQTVPGSATFEAVPFSGVMDMAGNALDTGPSNSRNARGALPGDGVLANPHRPVAPNELLPDNFWWSIRVIPAIDRSVPVIREVRPRIDEEGVRSDDPLTLTFTGSMWPSTLGDIALNEFPVANGADRPWSSPISELITGPNDTTFTEVTVRHRSFGPGGTPFYYFTQVPSTVRSANQNCFYPGRGPVADTPGLPTICDYEEDANGQIIRNTNCVSVSPQTSVDQDTGCVQTTLRQEAGQDLRVQPNIPACITVMQRATVSPVQP